MSWWSSLDKASQISKLAYSALKNAQQKIDEVLDIQDGVSDESGFKFEQQNLPPSKQSMTSSHPGEQFLLLHVDVQEDAKCVTPNRSPIDPDSRDSNLNPNKDLPGSSDERTSMNPTVPVHGVLPYDQVYNANPSPQDRTLSPFDSNTELESRRRMLSALNLFSAHSMVDNPRLHRTSTSDGGNLCASPSALFDSVQVQAHMLLVDEPDTTATGSDIEVLSRCTSTNGESSQPIGTAVSTFERIGSVHVNIPSATSGTGASPHTTSMLSRFHRRAVSASHAFHLGASRPREDDLAYAFQRLLKSYADKKALLQVREDKILQLSRENCGLREVNAILGEQLKESGNTHDLSELTAEFTERLAQTECRLRLISRERDQLKLSLGAIQAKLRSPTKQTEERSAASTNPVETNALNNRIAELERALSEKTSQVDELMREGEQLAQAQLKANTTIKQLRAKEKEAKKSERNQSEKNEQLNSQLERLRNDLNDKEDYIREITGQLEHFKKIAQAQETELQTLKVQYSHCQRSLQEKESQIEELNRELVGTQNQLSEAEARAEHGARSSASEQALRESCATLREQLDAARAECSSLKRSSDERYAQWHEEREYYQRLVAEMNVRLESMEELAQNAAQPALRQLESLQAQLTEQTREWNRREFGLNQQLTDYQKTAVVASESERAARQQLRDTEGRLTELNKQLSELRSENKGVQEQLDAVNKQLQSAQQTEKILSSKITQLMEERKVDTEQLDKLRAQLEQERSVQELTLQDNEQLKNQIRQLRSRIVQQTTPSSDSINPSSSQHASEIEDRLSSRSGSEPVTTVQASGNAGISRPVTMDAPPSPYPIPPPKEMGSHAVMEHMQALLRLKDGELTQLRREVEQLTRTKDSLLSELATASANSERLARLTGQTSQTLSEDSQLDEFQELQCRYNALLVLHGQITEENAELRMDLADVKEMYKTQIDMLLRDRG